MEGANLILLFGCFLASMLVINAFAQSSSSMYIEQRIRNGTMARLTHAGIDYYSLDSATQNVVDSSITYIAYYLQQDRESISENDINSGIDNIISALATDSASPLVNNASIIRETANTMAPPNSGVSPTQQYLMVLVGMVQTQLMKANMSYDTFDNATKASLSNALQMSAYSMFLKANSTGTGPTESDYKNASDSIMKLAMTTTTTKATPTGKQPSPTAAATSNKSKGSQVKPFAGAVFIGAIVAITLRHPC